MFDLGVHSLYNLTIAYPLHRGQLLGFSTFAAHVYLHRLHLYCMFYIMKKKMRVCKRTNYVKGMSKEFISNLFLFQLPLSVNDLLHCY
jgi:hypothetical protein